MSDLHDINDRLRRAATYLAEMAKDAHDPLEYKRLSGKSEGVHLAISYVEEALRDRVRPSA